jgi:arylsulfatase A-like enzyme
VRNHSISCVEARKSDERGTSVLRDFGTRTYAFESGGYHEQVATGHDAAAASSTARPDAGVSAQIAIAALAAALIGLADAALVVGSLLGARGAFQFVPARIWLVAPAVWIVVAVLAGAAVLPFTRRRAGASVAAILVMVFLAIRLRGHPALLLAVLAACAVLLALVKERILRWTARPRRIVAAGILGGVCAAALVAASQPLMSAPAAAQRGAGGPNVILVFLDTVRYDALFDADGRAHDDVPTVARLQRESTVFTRAYAPAPWTLPSHLSAMTGLPVYELGVSFDYQIYRRSDPTLAERFHREGYRTAAVISNSFLNAGTGVERGFDTFEQAQASLDICRTAPGLMADRYWPWFSAAVCNWTASAVTARALSLMDDSVGPFFLMLNYMDAHDPYYVEGSCGEPRGYRAAVRCLDRRLAPIVDWRSPRRPTVLAIVGDHGEQFGEHGLQRHGNSLYVQLLHVPLVVRSAGAGPARVRHEPISIAQLPALLDDPNAAWHDEGPLPALLHPPAASNLPSQWSALDGSWHLIVTEKGSEALYHLPTDPSETHDVIAEQRSDPAIARLRATIERMRRAPKPDLRGFRSLGYLQ